MRVALDTDVLVSAFATRGLCADVFNLVLAEHELIIGETVLAELPRVLRGKFRVHARLADEVVSLLREEGRVVKSVESLAVTLRDRSDLAVLSEAAACGAAVLITGDRDLLAIPDELPLRVLTPREFWTLLREA